MLICAIAVFCVKFPQFVDNGCPRRMTQVKNNTRVFDGCQWRCPSNKGNKVSIREGSFFTQARFSLRKGMLLAYCWALSMYFECFFTFFTKTDIPQHTQKQMIRLSGPTLIDWSQFFKDICSRWLLDHPSGIHIGSVKVI